MPYINASLDLTRSDAEFALEYVTPHDSIKAGYYRLRFKEMFTVYLTPQQIDGLITMLKEGGER